MASKYHENPSCQGDFSWYFSQASDFFRDLFESPKNHRGDTGYSPADISVFETPPAPTVGSNGIIQG
jgi:hypothetical protein